MKNPLCEYNKHLDVVNFLKDNFVCYSDKIVVPYAKDCYFTAPLFRKFDFHLNFTDNSSYYFWQIFKENKSLLMKTIEVFKKYPIADDKEFMEKTMLEEERPLYKAMFFLFLSSPTFEKNFTSSLSLDLRRVSLSTNSSFDCSDFVFHSYIDDFSLNDDRKIKELNSFESKIVVANNSMVANFIDHDHKIDFEDCYMLVSSK